MAWPANEIEVLLHNGNAVAFLQWFNRTFCCLFLMKELIFGVNTIWSKQKRGKPQKTK
jgi:hypothetical protein